MLTGQLLSMSMSILTLYRRQMSAMLCQCIIADVRMYVYGDSKRESK